MPPHLITSYHFTLVLLYTIYTQQQHASLESMSIFRVYREVVGFTIDLQYNINNNEVGMMYEYTY